MDHPDVTSPWFKCFPRAWTRNTRSLTLEERGAYFDCLCILYETERPIPDDDKWMSHQLHVSPRRWRALRTALIAGGFLVETEGGLVNPRAMQEIEARAEQRRKNRENAVKRERKKRETPSNEAREESENPENASEINESEPETCSETGTIKEIELEVEEEKEESLAAAVEQEPACAAAASNKFDILENKLRDACNGALANPAVAQGLYDLSAPLGWIKNGCDLETDILPTLRAIGKRDHGKGISSWQYFARPVAEAKARREAGLPAVDVQAGTVPKKTALQIISEMEAAGEF